jgi:TM2 domain-containing membrane protein YozV
MSEAAIIDSFEPRDPLSETWHLRSRGEDYGRVSGHVIVAWLAEGRIDDRCEVGSAEAWRLLHEDPVLSRHLPAREVAIRPQLPARSNPQGRETRSEGGVSVTINQSFSSAYAPRGVYDAGPRNPLYAMILSLLIPGAGQAYNGRAARAFLCFALVIVLWLVWAGWLMNLIAAFEAYLDAKALTLKYHRVHGDDGVMP